jgi:hypothetical protein
MGIGFGIGSVTFSIIRYMMQKNNKFHKMSSESGGSGGSSSTSCNDSGSSDSNINNGGSGHVIILGTLVDSHPETIIIGIIIALGMSSLLPTVLALFTGDFAARIVGTINMLDKGKSKQEVLRKSI